MSLSLYRARFCPSQLLHGPRQIVNMRHRHAKNTFLPEIARLQHAYHGTHRYKLMKQFHATQARGTASIVEASGWNGWVYGNSAVGGGYRSAAGVNAAMKQRVCSVLVLLPLNSSPTRGGGDTNSLNRKRIMPRTQTAHCWARSRSIRRCGSKLSDQ